MKRWKDGNVWFGCVNRWIGKKWDVLEEVCEGNCEAERAIEL
jgi:hypothetical protein